MKKDQDNAVVPDKANNNKKKNRNKNSSLGRRLWRALGRCLGRNRANDNHNETEKKKGGINDTFREYPEIIKEEQPFKVATTTTTKKKEKELIVEVVPPSTVPIESLLVQDVRSDGRFCELSTYQVQSLFGHADYIDTNLDMNHLIHIKSDHFGTVVRVRNERTRQEGGLLLWSNGQVTVGCWNPMQFNKPGTFQPKDKLTLLDHPPPYIHRMKLEEIHSIQTITAELGWNLSAENIRLGRCGVVGDYWNGMTIDYNLVGNNNKKNCNPHPPSIVGIWTDSVELPYSIEYKNDDSHIWTMYQKDCVGITMFNQPMTASKWRLHWTTTDFQRAHGLSTYRSGGGFHAELLVSSYPM